MGDRMTVESSKNKAGPFLAAGPSGTFPRDFLLIDADHLRVIRVRDEVETDLSAGISHTGIGTVDGTVTITAGIQAGDQVYLLRSVPKLQRSDYSAQGRVRADQVESDFDILAMQVQDLNEVQGRGLTIPVSSNEQGPAVIRAALEAPRHAAAAKASEEAAGVARTGAETARTGAEAARTTANAHATNAQTFRNQAQDARDAAAISAGNAASSEANANADAVATYHNTSPRAVEVCVFVSGGTSNSFQVSHNNSTWVTFCTLNYYGGAVVVPPGHYYRVTGSGGAAFWTELR